MGGRERTIHGEVDRAHGRDHAAEAHVEGGPVLVGGSKDSVVRTGDEGAGVADHVDVHEDKAGFRGGAVEAVFEGADEGEVVVVKRLRGVQEAVVGKGIRAGVPLRHKMLTALSRARDEGLYSINGLNPVKSATFLIGMAMFAGRTSRPRP